MERPGFAVLSGTTVTNTGFSTLNGDLGVSPGSALTGFPPGKVNGTIHATDPVANQAQSDLTTAYNDAAGRTPPIALPADIGGRTLTPGVHKSGASLGLTGVLTLDGQGDPNAVFVFQVGSALITAVGSRVDLINGAQPSNVFWQIGSSATLGTSSVFSGTILALSSISMNEGVTLNGRALARNGAVTLINDTINVPHPMPIPPIPVPSPCGLGTARPAAAEPLVSTPWRLASVSPDGKTLTLQYLALRPPAPFRFDRAEAVETSTSVCIAVYDRTVLAPKRWAAYGSIATTQLHLASPIGKRVIDHASLDHTGLPKLDDTGLRAAQPLTDVTAPRAVARAAAPKRGINPTETTIVPFTWRWQATVFYGPSEPEPFTAGAVKEEAKIRLRGYSADITQNMRPLFGPPIVQDLRWTCRYSVPDTTSKKCPETAQGDVSRHRVAPRYNSGSFPNNGRTFFQAKARKYHYNFRFNWTASEFGAFKNPPAFRIGLDGVLHSKPFDCSPRNPTTRLCRFLRSGLSASLP